MRIQFVSRRCLPNESRSRQLVFCHRGCRLRGIEEKAPANIVYETAHKLMPFVPPRPPCAIHFEEAAQAKAICLARS